MSFSLGRKQSYLPHQDAIKYVPACIVEPFQHDNYQDYHQAIVKLALTNQHLLIVTHREGLRDTSILCKEPFQNTPYCCTAVFSHKLVQPPARCFRKPQPVSSWSIIASPGAFQKSVDKVHPRRVVEDTNASGEEITTSPVVSRHHVPSATPAVMGRDSSDSSNAISNFHAPERERTPSSHPRPSFEMSLQYRERPAHSIYSSAGSEPVERERRRPSYTREDHPEPRASRNHFRSITAGGSHRDSILPVDLFKATMSVMEPVSDHDSSNVRAGGVDFEMSR